MDQQLITLTKRLVSIPSYVDAQNSEKMLENYLFKYLKRNFARLKIYRKKVEKDRFNLICSNSSNPTLVFICHMDTVRPSGNKTSMLKPRVVGNKLYGLGSVDMKGGIAATLEALRWFQAPAWNQKVKGIALIFDCDEEYYFKGVKKVLNEFKWKPKLAICPEPTDLKIINGCRGLIEITFDVIGKTAHAGSPKSGVNAIEKAVSIVKALRKEISENDIKELGKSTVNLSSLNGGRLQDKKITVQANAVPDIARVLLDIRTANPTICANTAKKLIASIAKRLGVQCQKIKVTLDYKPYLASKKELTLFEEATNKTGVKVEYVEDLGSKGFYEASLVSNAWQCPAISFGPGPAKMAHKNGEYVDIRSLQCTKEVFKTLIKLLQ
ncbi:M20/M25/M40 family metallo-hydrolase [Candidatus Dojkabacteria bacterium]|nr:M20/M25/M40 family metallo-hydrolase [Candidatus Dojkabacteria bacterium]